MHTVVVSSNMVAERGWSSEQISERICEQIADVHASQVVEQIIEVPKMTEQILDVPVLETVEQSVKLPSTVSDDRIQLRTAEHIADISVPQDVEEPAEFFKAFSQDRVHLRVGGQIIENPAIPLAEKIVELPVIQTEEKTQQGLNMCVQHVVNAVEVEKHIVQEKINQETKRIEISPFAVHRQGRSHPCRGAERGFPVAKP